MHHWPLIRVFVLAVSGLFVSGCSNLGYYSQTIGGHLDLLGRAKPVEQWMHAEDTPASLKERLQLAQRMRDFSVEVLGLPDNFSYRRYADLERPAAVWNVVATPELSLQLATWCFPVMGCIGYRGYFRQQDAEALASELRQQGYEVAVYGVPAYSTLGWLPGRFFSDPLLNTFIRYPEGELARMVFHELAHQVVYVENDTTFNESFATAVERLGTTRWLERNSTPEAIAEYRQGDSRREDFRALTARYRARLHAVYQGDEPVPVKRERKEVLMAEMRADYRQLRDTAWAGYSGYDGWFKRANNPALAVLGAYNDQVPLFERVFDACGRDFKRFYAKVQEIAALSRDQRQAALKVAACQ